MILTIYAVGMLILWTGTSFYLLVMSRHINYVKDILPTVKALPPVAIIIAVKDEEVEVEAALRSVCRLQYPNFRVIVINDRSTDGTAAILKRMSAENPLLEIITIEHLPQGWLGKNHALYQGYLASSEEWLLFTDADVKFAPDALTKAMTYTLQKGTRPPDHPAGSLIKIFAFQSRDEHFCPDAGCKAAALGYFRTIFHCFNGCWRL